MAKGRPPGPNQEAMNGGFEPPFLFAIKLRAFHAQRRLLVSDKTEV
jgi:hypothetical protein